MPERVVYRTIAYGEWTRPRLRNFREQCCDCGLIHRLDFRLLDGRIEFRTRRDNRATAAARRRFRGGQTKGLYLVASKSRHDPNYVDQEALSSRSGILSPVARGGGCYRDHVTRPRPERNDSEVLTQLEPKPF